MTALREADASSARSRRYPGWARDRAGSLGANPISETVTMATFLLIHGAWHGGWCWEEVVPLLAAQGHRVLAPDLPGMGTDATPWKEDVLGQWTDAMVALAEGEPEPVVLVGHSRAGLLVSTVAERVPKRVRLAVFLCAFVLADGETVLDVEERTEAVAAAVRPDEAAGRLGINAERAIAAFYHRAPPSAAERAVARLCDEPIQPLISPVRLTDDRFGQVPRAYIEATDDRAIPIATQRALQERWPWQHVATLTSDHSPFYTVPDKLALVLDELARESAEVEGA